MSFWWEKKNRKQWTTPDWQCCTQDTVSAYCKELNKSPKTISNIFAIYSKKTPLQIIHDRIILEAKRLFYYTDKSVKEISNDLGFDNAANFSSFFKNYTSQNPSDLRKAKEFQ